MRYALLPLATLLAAAALFSATSCTPRKNVGGLVGVPVPDFTLESYDEPGKMVGPEDFKGKVVLVSFWNTASAPCREAMPFLDNLYATYKEQGLDIIAVTTEARESVDTFKLDTKYDFPIYLDPDSKFLEAMRIYAIPSVTVVARNGVILIEGHPNEQNLLLESIQSALQQ